MRTHAPPVLGVLSSALLLGWAVACCGAVPDQGFGTARTADSGFYRGQFLNGRFHGRGLLEWRDGSRYAGEFRAGLMDGRGALEIHGTRERYRGEFKDGLMHGYGEFDYGDGSRYDGQFADGKPDGAGRYADANGDVYVGQFVRGRLSGYGSHSTAQGVQYRGEFLDWKYNGRGVFFFGSGDRYEGEFRAGLFHGAGRIRYADGANPDLVGQWREGEFLPPADESAPSAPSAPEVDSEALLFAQRERVDAALARIAAGTPGRIEPFFVGFAGDGDSDVFMKEARFAEAALAARYPLAGRSLLLINNRLTSAELPLASATNLEYALKGLAQRMNPDEDILILLFTSHGSDAHELELELGSAPFSALDADRLAQIVSTSGIRYKVIVVSACYSGGFIEPLLDDGTLVITAARHDHVSFGCGTEDELTYFGRAFFERALPQADSLIDAFQIARRVVHRMERERKFEHSEPQIAWGKAIRSQLERLESARQRTDRVPALER